MAILCQRSAVIESLDLNIKKKKILKLYIRLKKQQIFYINFLCPFHDENSKIIRNK